MPRGGTKKCSHHGGLEDTEKNLFPPRTLSREEAHSMIIKLDTQCPLSVWETHSAICVSSSPSKIPYGGFSPVRLKMKIQSRPSPLSTYTRPKPRLLAPLAPEGHVWRSLSPRPFHPEALGSPIGYSVRSGLRLLWPHPSHLWPPDGLSSSSLRLPGHERFPNLSHVPFHACHPQNPGGADGCDATVASPSILVFATFAKARPPHLHARWFSHGSCNEAASGSLALRPAWLLALHQQGLLRPSFRCPGHPGNNVGYNYIGTQSIPMTGLAPAMYAAVWAANEGHEGHGD